MLSKRTAGLIALALGAVAVVAGVLVWSEGASAAAARSSRPQPSHPPPGLTAPFTVPILMYHYVDKTPPDAGPDADNLTVSTAQFQAEMDYLAKAGYHPVTIAQIYAAMAGKSSLPDKPVAITFDDGGLDEYTVAFPILEEQGFRATFFVITHYVGYRLSMTWDQLRTMQAAGMEIESHTVSHPDLRRISPARLSTELEQSRTTLEQELGTEPRFLAYPYGKYNNAVIAALQAAGYLAAVTTHHPGHLLVPVSSYVWPRTGVAPGEALATFALVVRGPKQGSVR